MDILINNGITESTIVDNGVEVAIAQEISQTDIIGIPGISPDTYNFVQKTGDIMTGELELPSLQFDLTQTGATAEGQLCWNTDKGLLEAQLSQNFDLEIGQQIISKVVNKTGSTITKGKIVYINGGQGNRPTIALASNNTEGTSSKTFAVLAQDITDNGNGWAIVIGALYNVNTAAYLAGQTLYLGTSGDFTATKPVAPAHMVAVAKVVNVHATQGVLEINIQNGFELEELHNVLVTTPATNNILQLDVDGIWKNRSSYTGDVYSSTVFIEDQTFVAYGYINLDNNGFNFTDTAGGAAAVRTGAVGFWDTFNNVYQYLQIGATGSTELEYKDIAGFYLPIKMGATWLEDTVNSGVYGAVTYENSAFIFREGGTNFSPIVCSSLQLYDNTNLLNGTVALDSNIYTFYNTSGGQATIQAGVGGFSQGISVSTSGGNFLYTDFVNNRLGVGLINPAVRNHTHTASTTITTSKISNSFTGSTINDGFDLIVTAGGVAEIRQNENLQMDFYVNRTTNAGRFETTGKLLARNTGFGLRGVQTAITNRIDTVGNVGAGEDDLYSLSTPSSTLQANGDCLDIFYMGTFAANANNKRVRAYWGAQVLFDTTALAFNAGTWTLRIKVFRVTTTTLRAIAEWSSSNATLATQQTYTAFAGNVLTTNILKITGEATANNDITANVSTVTWIPII